MPRERLTPARVRDLRCPPDQKQVFLRDTEVPWLVIRATRTSKTYLFESTLKYRSIRITLPRVEHLELEEAREQARNLQKLIAKEIDPREHARKQEEQERQAKAAADAERQRQAEAAAARQKYTLRALLHAYTEHLKAQGKTGAEQSARSAFRLHVVEAFPEVAKKPAREVTAHEIVAIVRKVKETGRDHLARSLRSYLLAAFNAASKAPFDPRLPSALIQFGVEVNPVQRIPAMPTGVGDHTLAPAELGAYAKALGDDLSDQALKLALYAGGQRMRQLLRAKVRDWDPGTKTLRLLDPKGRRTRPREHLLPLAPVAAEVVKQLATRAKGKQSEWLFVYDKAPLDPGLPGKRLREINNAIDARPFDLRDVRRTCETMLAGLGVSRDVRAQLLSHGVSGVQAIHYDRYSYADEKRAALTLWESHLASLLPEDDE